MNTVLNLNDVEQQQIEKTQTLIAQSLGNNVLAVYLYGSVVEEGLQPYSDIDFWVVIKQALTLNERASLMKGLLEISAYPRSSKIYRALEVTIVIYSEIIPWNFPPKRELQFGEWLRDEMIAGQYGQSEYDADLVILLTKVRNTGVALIGESAQNLLPIIPIEDLFRTLEETLQIWQEPKDLIGDERNIILTLARILFSRESGQIIGKSQAVQWLLPQLSGTNAEILQLAHNEYLGLDTVDWSTKFEEVEAFVHFIKEQFIQSSI